MKVVSDTIRVAPATHTPDGEPLEPERRPAERRTLVESVLTMSSGELIPNARPVILDQATTAGEIAQKLRSSCATCRHWDNPGWIALAQRLEWGTPEERAFIREARAAIDGVRDVRFREAHSLDPADPNDMDLEHAVRGLGLCQAQTAIFSRFEGALHPVITHPHAGCPEGLGPGGEVLAGLYAPRDRAADTAAARAYDRIMQMAQGRTPTT